MKIQTQMTMQTQREPGFTILEVVIAMAMLAMIAVPAVGLATMALKQQNTKLVAGRASELKSRVEASILAGGAFANVATEYYANKDLSHFVKAADRSGIQLDPEDEWYYRVELSLPSGYSFAPSDPYRLFICRITWPDSPAPSETAVETVSLIAFRK